jgi:hypothetical protein
MNTICETKTRLIKEPNNDIGIKRDYYVYYLIDPRDDLPFYVGKGKNWRMYRHESNVINGKVPNGTNKILFKKIKSIIDCGFKIKYLKIKENLLNDESKIIEIQEIAKLSKNIFLCNGSPGGDDRPSLEYIGKRHSLLMMGHKTSNETKKKMSNSWWRNRGDLYLDYARKHAYEINFNKYWVGKKRSDESKKKYSLSKLGNLNPMFKEIQDNVFKFIHDNYVNGISLRKIKTKLKIEFDECLSINKIIKELKSRGVYGK